MSRTRPKFGVSQSKFLDGIGEQLDRVGSTQHIEIKTIPVSSISFQPGNPRKLEISPKDITDNLPDLQLPPAALENDADKDWLESYETLVQERFGSGKKKDDFMSLARFAASMKSASRLLHPIVVWREETRFLKITGERRLLAHVLLGEATIRATVWEEKPSRFDLSRIQWEENIQRENFDLAEDLDALEGILDAWKEETGKSQISVDQFRNITGLSRTQAHRYLKILSNGTPELRQAINEHRVDNLATAHEFAGFDSPDHANHLLAKYLSGATHMTHKEVRRERARKGKATRKRPPTRTPNVVNPTFVRRMREQDRRALEKMVAILRGAFKGSDLDNDLAELSMEKSKDVSVAFQKIYEHIKQLSDKAKG